MSLGTKIQALREEKDLSQKELANLVGVSTGTIAEWEADEAQPNIAVLANLSKALSVTTDALLETTFEETAPIVKQSSVTATTTPSKKQSKRFKVILSAVACIVVVAVVVLFFMGKFDGLFAAFMPEETLAFSEDTAAIEAADASVVTLFCYDVFGEQSATGSGFVAFDSKTIITNYHVIKSAYKCKISTNQDISFDVTNILCYSEEYDIAILQLEKDTGLAPLTLGNANDIKKGEPVVAIGSPLGIKNTVSSGILSGRIMESAMDVLQFTAPISSGSSGGALFDDNGNVIGITYASYENGQNLNLAIPIEIAGELYKNTDLCDFSKIYVDKHPYVPTLLRYKDAPIVSFSDLKQNPQKYDEQYVVLYAHVSSKGQEEGYWFVSDEQNVSYDFEHDAWLDSTSNRTNFYDSPVIAVEISRGWVERSISEGDCVMIVAHFEFFKRGELFDSEFAYLDGVIVAPAE